MLTEYKVVRPKKGRKYLLFKTCPHQESIVYSEPFSTNF